MTARTDPKTSSSRSSEPDHPATTKRGYPQLEVPHHPAGRGNHSRHRTQPDIAHVADAARGDTTVGRATVTDGDTLGIRSVKFRLHGIDAPESSQTCRDARGAVYRCGALSANKLSEKIGVRNVTCTEKDRDRYGRIVAVCSAGGEDLNAWMVSQGLAVAYRQYSKDYVALEDRARRFKRGLWAGTFQLPSEYRANPSNPPTAGTAPKPTPPNRTPSTPRFSSCAQARAAGAAPLLRGTPGYNPALDRDKDGIACE